MGDRSKGGVSFLQNVPRFFEAVLVAVPASFLNACSSALSNDSVVRCPPSRVNADETIFHIAGFAIMPQYGREHLSGFSSRCQHT